MKHGRKQAEVSVQLTYPTTNHLDDKTDETGMYVSLEIIDEASGQLVVKLELSATQWTQIMSARGIRVSDAQVSAYPHRLGKQHTITRLETWKVGDGRLPITGRDEFIELARKSAEATGQHEVVTINRHNWGTELIGHNWVEPEAA